MNWQMFGVLIVVAACAGHTAWSLAPRAWRQQFARWAASTRLGTMGPARLQNWLAQHAQPIASGCACTGCDKGSAGAQPTSNISAGMASNAQTAPKVHVVQWVRKPSGSAPSSISPQNR